MSEESGELYSLLHEMTIVQKIKVGLLRWAGHVVRMGPQDHVEFLFNLINVKTSSIAKTQSWDRVQHKIRSPQLEDSWDGQ